MQLLVDISERDYNRLLRATRTCNAFFYDLYSMMTTAILNGTPILNGDILQHYGYDKGHQDGLNDAWNCAGRIVCDCNYPNNHLRQYVTNGDTLVKFFIDTSASEAIAKVNEYELKQKGANIC